MKIKRLAVDFYRMDDNEYPGPDFVKFNIMVLVEREDATEKQVKFQYSNMFHVDHFKPMWEQLMERATLEIGAAVKAAEEKNGAVE